MFWMKVGKNSKRRPFSRRNADEGGISKEKKIRALGRYSDVYNCLVEILIGPLVVHNVTGS